MNQEHIKGWMRLVAAFQAVVQFFFEPVQLVEDELNQMNYGCMFLYWIVLVLMDFQLSIFDIIRRQVIVDRREVIYI